MSLTNFPNGITSMGVPILGGQGLLTQGTSFFVDPVNGSDGNSGLDIKNAIATLSKAQSLATANQNDVVYYFPGSAGLTETAKVTWAKNFVHLVGIAAPVTTAGRARIKTTATGSPMWDITADGCGFYNIQWFHGVANANALVDVQVTGERNYFADCHFAGIGNATQDAANAASLLLNGASECLFRHCTIGLDTIDRGTASNWELAFDGSATRNRFEDCKFTASLEANTHVFVKEIDTLGSDRATIFKDCEFISFSDGNNFDMLQAFDINSGGAGSTRFYLLINPVGQSVTNWETTATGRVQITGQSSMGATTGLAVDVTP